MRQLLRGYVQMGLVIDALDECSERRKLLEVIKDFSG